MSPSKSLLPEEVLEEILLRLQVVDLLRFKCVSEKWNSIISSTHFIQSHLKKSTASPSHHRILMPYGTVTDTFKTTNCSDVYGDVVIDDIPGPNKTEVTILGSCNGLVCFYENNSICVWNPAMRVSRSLKTIMFYWFGYDDDEYKLVIGTYSKREVSHHISLIRPYADCDWKSTEEIDEKRHLYFHSRRLGTFFIGRVYWPAYENLNRVVFSYDLRRKTVAVFPAPDQMDCSATMCVMNGCLSAIWRIFQGEESVWTMKEYGVKESWTKFAILAGVDLPRGYSLDDRSSFLLGVTNKGDLIFNVGGKVLLYNMEENKSKTLATNIHGPYGMMALMYVETLIFPVCKN